MNINYILEDKMQDHDLFLTINSPLWLLLKDNNLMFYLIHYYTFLITFSSIFGFLCIFRKKEKTKKLIVISIISGIILDYLGFMKWLLDAEILKFSLFFEAYIVFSCLILIFGAIYKKTRNIRTIMNAFSMSAFTITTLIFHTAVIDVTLAEKIKERDEYMTKAFLMENREDFFKQCLFFEWECGEYYGSIPLKKVKGASNFDFIVSKSIKNKRKEPYDQFYAADGLYNWLPESIDVDQYSIYTNREKGYQRYALDKNNFTKDLRVAKLSFFILTLSQSTAWLIGIPLLILFHEKKFNNRRKRRHQK